MAPDDSLDFTACMRPNGTVYGTAGRCRQGQEISLNPGEGMPLIAGKANRKGIRQPRVKEIADEVRAKHGVKQVKGEALQSVVRRLNEELERRKGGKAPQPAAAPKASNPKKPPAKPAPATPKPSVPKKPPAKPTPAAQNPPSKPAPSASPQDGELKRLRKLLAKGTVLGKGAMGKAVRDAGPPPTIIKQGSIGEFEVEALKRLAGTGVAPVVVSDLELGPKTRVKGGLGGHVSAGKGILQMSEAPGKVTTNLYRAPKQQQIEQMDAVMEARAKMHLRGVAHNDMHTGNVFYDPATKKATIVDFGLAQVNPKAALIEALGTGRLGDYQSTNHFYDVSIRNKSAKFQRFDSNRNAFIKKTGIGSLHHGKIRSKPEDFPAPIRNMTDAEAEAALRDLYRGVI